MKALIFASLAALGLVCAAVADEGDVTIRLAGSTTVGQKLAKELFRGFAAKQGMASFTERPLSQDDEYEILATRPENDNHLALRVEAHGTKSGAPRLVARAVDLWMASSRASQSHLDEANLSHAPNVPSLDEIRRPYHENVIALDALAIIVHQTNLVKSLSLAQIADIYSGAATNWSQVGGDDLPIAVLSRDGKSGTFDTFCALALKLPREPDDRCLASVQRVAKPPLVETNEDMSERVASDPGAIGFVGFAFAGNARVVPIATRCATVSTPSEFAVKAEEYLFTRRLYLYSWDKLSPQAQSFLEYVKSDAAQPIVKDAGFADFRSTPASEDYVAARLDSASNALDDQRTRIRPSDVHVFEAQTARASRLPITFRFEEGSGEIEARSLDDLKRLADLMHSPAFANKELVLIGFTQSAGDYELNRQLSKDRAEAVSERLRQDYGVAPASAVGVGPAAPVACNLDPDARWINQRVEAWVRPAH